MYLKGLCHEMNIFLKTYNNKWVLSVHELIVFTTFRILVDEKIINQSKFLRIFPAANERLAIKTSTYHREGNSEEGFSKHQ
jgi:hypothetical protein